MSFRHSMKWLTTIIFLITIPSAYSGQAVVIDLTKDNPNTLLGRTSKDYTIYGLRLGLTHEQAWQNIEKTRSLMGVKDNDNPSRIYVYSRNSDGSKGKAGLYLVWQPNETKMSRITVFQDFRPYLSQNFQRLLTFEALDNNSISKREFIGYANRSKTTLDLPSIGTKHVTYFYEEIGLEIVHKHSAGNEEIAFAIVQAE